MPVNIKPSKLFVQTLTKVDALFALNKDDELVSVLEEIIYLNPHSPLKGLLNSLRKEHGKWCY